MVATISITNTLSFSADAEGTSAMFARERKARNRWTDRLASGISQSFMADDYFDEDDKADK